MKWTAKAGANFGAGMRMRNNHLIHRAAFRGDWQMKLRREGQIIWEVEYKNIITNEGLNHILDVELSGATQVTTWYIGLVSGATPTFAAADVMNSHAGWTEFTSYSEANRVTWVDNGVSSQSVSNSGGNVATFTMSGGGTIGGAFLVSENTKGGTTGVLYAEGDFATDRTVVTSDVLEVTATFSSADDGA